MERTKKGYCKKLNGTKHELHTQAKLLGAAVMVIIVLIVNPSGHLDQVVSLHA